MVDYLISNGANTNVKDEYGNTPLHYASLYGKSKVVKYLINKGADINKKNNKGNTPLHYAS